jgi:hypothetical protein
VVPPTLVYNDGAVLPVVEVVDVVVLFDESLLSSFLHDVYNTAIENRHVVNRINFFFMRLDLDIDLVE